jgi:hypothetical protein
MFYLYVDPDASGSTFRPTTVKKNANSPARNPSLPDSSQAKAGCLTLPRENVGVEVEPGTEARIGAFDSSWTRAERVADCRDSPALAWTMARSGSVRWHADSRETGDEIGGD